MKRGFVPMRHGFIRESEVLQIAAELHGDSPWPIVRTAQAVAGALAEVWSWVDLTSESEHVRGNVRVLFEMIDTMASWPGIAKAMQNVGWLVEEEGGVYFPGLKKWILRNARERRKARERMRALREAKYGSEEPSPECSGEQDAHRSRTTRARAPKGQGKGSSTSSEVDASEEARGAPRCNDAPQPEQAEPTFSTTWLVPYYKTHQELVGEPVRIRLEKALRPIHDKYGEGRVHPVWEYFCETVTGRFFTPESFAQKFVTLEREMQTRGASAAGRSLTAAETTMREVAEVTKRIDPSKLGASPSLAEIVAQRQERQGEEVAAS